MSDLKLKSCPFCGDYDVHPTTDEYGQRVIKCGGCMAMGPIEWPPRDHIERWNERRNDD